MIGERRLDTLRDLGSALGAVRSEPEVMEAVGTVIGAQRQGPAVQPDLPARMPIPEQLTLAAETGGMAGAAGAGEAGAA